MKISQNTCEKNIQTWLEKKPHLVAFFKNFLNLYQDEGSLYLVGGLIRDLALDKSSHKDIDFMIDLASEAEVTEILQKLKKQKQIHFFQKVGKSFPVFKVKIDGEEEALDFALARVERSLGKGHDNFWVDAEKISCENDGKRRDFTVNALFGQLILIEDQLTVHFVDYFQGLKDLNEMKLRAVGNAHERMVEDPLRILRAIRFCHQKGFSLDAELQKVIACESRSLLPELSHDRIQEELIKTMTSNFYEALNDFIQYKFFEICFPNIDWFPTENQDYFKGLVLGNADLIYPLLLIPYLAKMDFSSKNFSMKEIDQDLNQIHCRRQKKVKDCVGGLVQLIHRHHSDFPLAIEEKVLQKDQGYNISFLYNHFKKIFFWSDLDLHFEDNQPSKISGNELMSWGIRPRKGFENVVLYIRQLQLNGETDQVLLKKAALSYKY
ncbi:hypothetical protein MJH12_15665 [bacterium]|nr:hypothetical protein [bacterium]